MARSQARPQTIKQPKAVSLTTYLQSIALTAMVVGVAAFMGGYFTMQSMHSEARSAVVKDLLTVKEAAKKVSQ